MKKVFGIIMIVLVGLMLLGCNSNRTPRYLPNKVMVYINHEFYEVFMAREITIEDFSWDNIRRIHYLSWSHERSIGLMSVYLYREGQWRVRRAVSHFNRLDFVESAYRVSWPMTPGVRN